MNFVNFKLEINAVVLLSQTMNTDMVNVSHNKTFSRDSKYINSMLESVVKVYNIMSNCPYYIPP